MRRLILASTSSFRRALLERLGVPFEAVAPIFDESAIPGLGPLPCAEAFAVGKARSLVGAHPSSLIIGADQVLELEGEIVRKTTSEEDARRQLALLAGKTHALHSAVAVVDADSGRIERGVATTRLTMRALQPAEISSYVSTERPIGTAGGYLYEKLGVSLFEEVTGSDDSAIVGLPLLLLCRLLRAFGIDPLDRG
jgi:septum formation protein